jgi:DNA-binding NarL/FixJ family response regulator
MRNGGKGYLPKNISEASSLKLLYAVGRGEIAIPWAMVSEVVDELQRVSKAACTKENEKRKMLTFREVEVPGLLASEASNDEIGRELFISNNTVRVDVHNISEKLQTRNRREASKLAQGLSNSTNGSPLQYGEKGNILKSR